MAALDDLGVVGHSGEWARGVKKGAVIRAPGWSFPRSSWEPPEERRTGKRKWLTVRAGCRNLVEKTLIRSKPVVECCRRSRWY